MMQDGVIMQPQHAVPHATNFHIASADSRTLCELCSTPGKTVCASCKSVRYCSRQCQKEHWIQHKFICKPEEVTNADHLVLSVVRRFIPGHPPAIAEYGFMTMADDSGDLVDFYRYLIVSLGVTAKQLTRWQKEGTLADSIHSTLTATVTPATIFWLPWFLQRKDKFTGKEDFAAMERHANKDLQATWEVICRSNGEISRIKEDAHAATRDWPAYRYWCFTLWRLILMPTRPNPMQKFYLWFGFGAGVQKDDVGLQEAYEALITKRKCAFDEFAEGYLRGKLWTLFETYGVTRGLTPPIHPDTKDILAGSPHHFKPVWHLKQYALNVERLHALKENPIAFEPDEYALKQFGFGNCKNVAERRTLAQMYAKVLDHPNARALELEAAKERREIFQYVAGLPHVKIPKHDRALFERLMKPPPPRTPEEERIMKDITDRFMADVMRRRAAAGIVDT